MQNQAPLTESLGQSTTYLKSLIEVKVDQAKLQAIEKSSKVISSLFTVLVIGATAGLSALFGFIALAIYLGQLLQNAALGFLAVAGLLLLITGCFYLFKRQLITNPIITYIIQLIYEKEEKEADQ
ncbi:MAG: hypothetical protein Sapg2KO_53010 [Saprospiraceae bacterium]